MPSFREIDQGRRVLKLSQDRTSGQDRTTSLEAQLAQARERIVQLETSVQSLMLAAGFIAEQRPVRPLVVKAPTAPSVVRRYGSVLRVS